MLTFIKLGGSLITDKQIPFSARKQTIKRLGLELLAFHQDHPTHRLVIGHGSGSFGHAAAVEYGTMHGVRTAADWEGFQAVWWAAHQLNQIVCEILIEVGLPIIAMPASASAIASNRQLRDWQIEPLSRSLENGLIPLIYGDVIVDTAIGGTILSTEELFTGLIPLLKPDRILLAGIDAGVYRDYPLNKILLEKITPQSIDQGTINLRESSNRDVTGGMASKVAEMAQIVKANPSIMIQIFSGELPGNLNKVLAGTLSGTSIAIQ
jgi:isopentenyl phosphate kinase